MIKVRDARAEDAAIIVTLVKALAANDGDTSPIHEGFVQEYMDHPGCHILLADLNGKVVGLISYTLRPNLYHSALCGVIEELVVSEASRGQGIGHALIAEVITRLQALECAEISVSTLMENRDAQRFYRSHGLVDEAILLERHF